MTRCWRCDEKLGANPQPCGETLCPVLDNRSAARAEAMAADGRLATGLALGALADLVAPDPVNHPPHYTRGGIEVIDALEAWELGFHLGNAVKYIARAGHKGDALEDLRKARWYLDREIARRERAKGG